MDNKDKWIVKWKHKKENIEKAMIVDNQSEMISLVEKLLAFKKFCIIAKKIND